MTYQIFITRVIYTAKSGKQGMEFNITIFFFLVKIISFRLNFQT